MSSGVIYLRVAEPSSLVFCSPTIITPRQLPSKLFLARCSGRNDPRNLVSTKLSILSKTITIALWFDISSMRQMSFIMCLRFCVLIQVNLIFVWSVRTRVVEKF